MQANIKSKFIRVICDYRKAKDAKIYHANRLALLVSNEVNQLSTEKSAIVEAFERSIQHNSHPRCEEGYFIYDNVRYSWKITYKKRGLFLDNHKVMGRCQRILNMAQEPLNVRDKLSIVK